MAVKKPIKMNQPSKLPLLKIDLLENQGSRNYETKSNKPDLISQNPINQLKDSVESELTRVNIIKMFSGVILYNGYGLLKSISHSNIT